MDVLYLLLLIVGRAANVADIAADVTLSTTTGAESPHVHKLTPTGAHRNVILPTATRSILGLPYVIQNASASYNLVLKNGSSGGTTVLTLAPGRAALVIVWFDGTSTYAWTYLSLGGSTAATNSATTGVSTGAAGTGNTGNGNLTACLAALIGTPAAASATAVHANYDAAAANTWTGTFSNPDLPRNVTATFSASWDGGNLVVSGTDQFDAAITETIVASAGATVAGVKVFKTVTGATKASTGTAGQTASLGTGNKLGLSTAMTLPVGSLVVGGASEPATFDSTYSAVTPSTNTPNGSRVYHALYPQAAAHVHTGPSHTHSVTDPGHSHA